ncbi:gliding motility protein [Streptomyces sp. NPDC097619]|uniref:gliding motility protein n=1 Tax=Streptomyces sp. NPDC097619 TaxID=3157228 RepID=UPI00331E8AFE
MGVFSRFRRKAKDAVEAVAEEAPRVPAPVTEPEAAGEAGVTTVAGGAAEGVEIPKQQSAEPAPSGTGEGART